MYKSYKHKLNMMEPGGKMISVIVGLLIAGGIFRFFGQMLLSNIMFLFAGIIALILTVLLVVEQHEDKVLNEQALRLEKKLEAGIQKKSFVLNYNNGEIWCEHLDSMGDYKQKVLEKFQEDLLELSKINMPTLIVVNLDETMTDHEILKMVLDSYAHLKQQVRKVVFVGLSKTNQRLAKKIIRETKEITYITAFIDDFEKAKEWLI